MDISTKSNWLAEYELQLIKHENLRTKCLFRAQPSLETLLENDIFQNVLFSSWRNSENPCANDIIYAARRDETSNKLHYKTLIDIRDDRNTFVKKKKLLYDIIIIVK